MPLLLTVEISFIAGMCCRAHNLHIICMAIMPLVGPIIKRALVIL